MALQLAQCSLIGTNSRAREFIDRSWQAFLVVPLMGLIRSSFQAVMRTI